MSFLPQVRGAILEEVLLYLLQRAGYRTVEHIGGDPTLQAGGAGLEVMGRGHWHQIDAIADYVVAQPFAHPQRLLLEAKFYNKPIGIEVARNAIGVLKDVSEFWVTRHGAAGTRPHRRYHYQYALFSVSGYTKPAQSYAFAQDVYLIELQDNWAVRPILNAIQQVSVRDLDPRGQHGRVQIGIGDVREAVRRRLRGGALDLPIPNPDALEEIVRRCRQLDGALLGMINGQFPVFLVPFAPVDEILARFRDYAAFGIPVRIQYNDDAWFLVDGTKDPMLDLLEDRDILFAFDLPPALFEMYARSGHLGPEAALNMKQEMMGQIDATLAPTEGSRLPTLVRFTLDQNWLSEVRERTRGSLPPDE